MIHALAYVAFILPFTAWLGWELNKKFSLKTYWYWVAAAVAATLAGSFIFAFTNYSKSGNFVLHASGGVSAVFLFIYLTNTLRFKFTNWKVGLLILFAWVSMLGVMNELAEYFLELLQVGIYSEDTHDTWRDFTANTTGMLIAWLSLKALALFDKH